MDWKPIETAPKDGTMILLYGEGVMFIGAWMQSAAGRMFVPYSVCTDCMCKVPAEPTHWTYLPKTPDKEKYGL